MRKVLFLCVAGLGASSAALAADAARPPITSVSHLAVYAADAAKAEHFYVHDLGAVKRADPENPQGARYHFSSAQFVEVLPLPANAGANRMDHVAFNTANAESLRKYLAAKNIQVPAAATKGADGSQWFQVKDPEGILVEFVQPPSPRPAIAANPLFGHIIHVGAVVHDRALEDGFYRDILGFRPYWFGGMKDDTPTRVTHRPCQAPMATPPAIAIATATSGLTSCLTVSNARISTVYRSHGSQSGVRPSRT